ncbi:MAG: hypothetical protein KBD67_05775 [Anaerolineaceae bacterium]|nr:hypothetical protein [Anaerolineaceae bacterium]
MAETRKNTFNLKEEAEKRFGFIKSFNQTSWRNRVRSSGFFLLALVVILLMASVYLSISGKAASAGLSAYRLDLKRMDLEREIAHKHATLALITSAPAMQERAKALGFAKINPEDAFYLNVPGYAGRQTVVVAPPPGIPSVSSQLIKSIYRESLWDWLFSGINQLTIDSLRGGN